MSVSQELIQQFKAFVCDDSLDQPQIVKYLIWGKNCLETSLNYYYTSKDNNKHKKEVEKNSSTAWQKLKDGAKKEKQTHQHIQNLKREYKLPVVSKPNSKQYFDNGSKRFGQADFLPSLMSQKNNIQDELEEKQAEEDIQSQQESKLGTKKTAHTKQRQTKVNAPNNIKKIQEPKFMKATKIQKVQNNFQNSNTQNNRSSFQSNRINQSIRSQGHQLTKNNEGLFLGELFIDCFSVYRIDLNTYNNQQISVKPFSNKKTEKNKKGNKSKATQEKVVVRLNWQEKDLGRFEDNEARIFCHLLNEQYITLKCWLFDFPPSLNQFSRYRLRAEVYLQKKAITNPIVETFQNQKSQNPILTEFKEIKEQLNSLLLKLKLNILTPPLIQLKSKYQTQNRALIKSESRYSEQKNTKQLIQKMTNPFYKEVQVKLSVSTNATIQKKVQEKPIVQEDYNVQIKQDQYDQLINLNECKLSPTQPRSTFVSELHEYQGLALTWTLFRQGFYKSQEREQLHPMWMQFQLPDSQSLFFNQFTGQLSVKPPVHKNRCKGGILADEMGLGKTVMMIALICTNIETKCKYKTLVVVPLTLLDQWESQINAHTKYNSVRVYKYYDRKSRTEPLQNYDVIITTYGVISNQFSQGLHISKQGLFRNSWFRVILDEAHYIKGRVIQTSRAVFSLNSEINWCLTGTPIQNKLDDIYSLIHFIRYTPWSDYTWWNTYINKPHNENDPAVFPVLRTILKNVLLRRTKQSKLQNGDYIIHLPPKISKIRYLNFKEDQRKFYDAIYQVSKKQFDELENQGAIEAKYMRIFQILVRLRQICCHRALFKSIPKLTNSMQQFQEKLSKFVQKKISERNSSQNDPCHFELLMDGDQQIVVNSAKLSVNQAHMKQVIDSINNNTIGNCLICLSQVDNPVVTVCLHIFCKTCLIQSINNIRGFCPLCRTIISKDDFMYLPHQNRLRLDFKSQFQRSTKMQALFDLITSFNEEDKVVVFSQFLGMLDLIEEDFRRQKIGFTRMDGSLSQKQRGAVIQKFKNDKKCKVFLISLKTGGVGLNLVVANKVILVDPWWNPAVQEQAIERVHRIGQKRPVEVWRLIINNSIESRMMQLHESKRQVSNMAISERDSKQNFAQKFKYLMTKY